jgi:transposase, IS5 family
VFTGLLDPDNTCHDIWADSGYRAVESLQELAKQEFQEHLQLKGNRHRKLTDEERQANWNRSKTRSRVEHVFGMMAMRTGKTLMRGIGIIRIRAKIGLPNLAYNVSRFALMAAA